MTSGLLKREVSCDFHCCEIQRAGVYRSEHLYKVSTNTEKWFVMFLAIGACNNMIRRVSYEHAKSDKRWRLRVRHAINNRLIAKSAISDLAQAQPSNSALKIWNRTQRCMHRRTGSYAINLNLRQGNYVVIQGVFSSFGQVRANSC